MILSPQESVLSDKDKYIIFLDSISVTKIFSTSNKANAIVMLEGDGFARVNTTAELYKAGISDIVIFSGGIEDESYGSYPFNKVKPKLLEEGIAEKDLILESKSLNTKDQAVEILNICEAKEWKNIIIVASQFHIYRAYLTFIAEWNRRKVFNLGYDLKIFPSAVKNQDWYVKNTYGKRIDLLDNEFIRIEKYRTNGDVASFQEGVEYLKWLMS